MHATPQIALAADARYFGPRRKLEHDVVATWELKSRFYDIRAQKISNCMANAYNCFRWSEAVGGGRAGMFSIVNWS